MFLLAQFSESLNWKQLQGDKPWWEIDREVEEEQRCGGEEQILGSSTHN